jgi:ribose/xylose/arabinose/galactoside ABC-type transport system permease subunit
LTELTVSDTDLLDPGESTGQAGGLARARAIGGSVLANHLIWPLCGVLLLVGLGVDGFFSERNLINVVWSATPLACMTLGMLLVMVQGSLDLSIESTFAVAPTLGILVAINWMAKAPDILALPVCVAVGMAIGLINGLISVKLRVNPFLVTLATMMILRGIVVYLIPEGVYSLPEVITFWGGDRLGKVPIAILVTLALVVVLEVMMRATPFGKAIYAIGNNEPAAFMAGINVQRVKIWTFVLAGLLAAIGGLLQVGRLDSVTADMGDGNIMMVFAAATLGGTSLQGGQGRVSGVFGAALLITGIENIMNLIGVEPSVRRIAFGLILLIAICVASLQERVNRAGNR